MNKGITTYFGQRASKSWRRTLAVVKQMRRLKIEGIVTSGIGKGSYYTSISHYSGFFERLLGGKIASGTLNVRLKNMRWYDLSPIYKKFAPQDGYGAIYYAYASLCGETVLIVRPEKTTHGDDVIEVVAKCNLKSKFGLKDGDKIELEVIE